MLIPEPAPERLPLRSEQVIIGQRQQGQVRQRHSHNPQRREVTRGKQKCHGQECPDGTPTQQNARAKTACP